MLLYSLFFLDTSDQFFIEIKELQSFNNAYV